MLLAFIFHWKISFDNNLGGKKITFILIGYVQRYVF